MYTSPLKCCIGFMACTVQWELEKEFHVPNQGCCRPFLGPNLCQHRHHHVKATNTAIDDKFTIQTQNVNIQSCTDYMYT